MKKNKGQAKTVTFEQLNSSPLTSSGSPTYNKVELFTFREVRLLLFAPISRTD